MEQVVGWTVLALAASWALCTNIALRQYYKHSGEPALPANATAMTQLASVITIPLAGYSPFHLLWLLPVSYFTGFFALRSRIVGRLAWLYGYVVAYTIPTNWWATTRPGDPPHDTSPMIAPGCNQHRNGLPG